MAVNLPLSEAQLRSLILGVKTNYLAKTNYLVKTNSEDELAEDELPQICASQAAPEHRE